MRVLNIIYASKYTFGTRFPYCRNLTMMVCLCMLWILTRLPLGLVLCLSSCQYGMHWSSVMIFNKLECKLSRCMSLCDLPKAFWTSIVNIMCVSWCLKCCCFTNELAHRVWIHISKCVGIVYEHWHSALHAFPSHGAIFLSVWSMKVAGFA